MADTVKSTVNTILEKLNLSSKEESAPVQEPEATQVKDLKEKYHKAGQDQVFKFYEELDTAGQASLFGQLSTIDPDYINEITNKALHPPESSDKEGDTKLEPLPDSATASVLDSETSSLESWYSSGLDLIAQGKVAVVLMAGGQGTRLGSSAPKGCFNIGLPSEKSLFQIQAERIWKVQRLAAKKHGKENVIVPWYVMTSGPTRGPTEKFFKEHNYFGLSQDNVLIFEQGVLPCISNEGKILLEGKSKVLGSHSNRSRYAFLIHLTCRLLLLPMEMVVYTKLF